MAWITPKIDWHPSNEEGVAGADFNRIEGNIDYIYSRFFKDNLLISGGGTGLLLSAGAEEITQTIYIALPHNKAVSLRNFRSGGFDTDFTIKVLFDGAPVGEIFTASAVNSDLGWYPDFTPKDLGGNTSGVTVQKKLLVKIKNNAGFDKVIARESSWQFSLAIR